MVADLHFFDWGPDLAMPPIFLSLFPMISSSLFLFFLLLALVDGAIHVHRVSTSPLEYCTTTTIKEANTLPVVK